jgi:NADH oxidase (H2O2-forming)
VIIGCGAGGGTAAQFARKTDRKSSVTIFEKGKYPQYSKCGLPYTISIVIPKTSDLIEFSEEWFRNANIDLLLETTVEKIDTNKQIVFAKKGNAVIEKSYGSLIICTGARPFFPPIQNIEEDGKLADGVYVVRSIDDAEKIFSHVKKDGNATIVGAGLIGLEMADALHKKGMNVAVVELLPHILANTIDEDMSKIVHEKIPGKIKLFTNHLAIKIESKNGKISKVFIKNNETDEEQNIDTDLLIIATGSKPNVSLAKDAGCKIGETGGIVVNGKSETSVKNIYAVGDCTEYLDFVTKKAVPIGLGSIAVRQGITAGINAAGGDYKLPNGVLQTRTSEFFDLEIAAVGPTIDFIKDMSVVSGKFNGYSLPDYFPGGKPISLKVTVDEKTGRILSAQAVGDNAAQRINTFACAILGGIDIETFRKLETAYAPPIAPTLDAVTLVCDIVSKKLSRNR